MTGQESTLVMSDAAAQSGNASRSKEIVAQLRAARALLERGWTTGQFARDADGDVVDIGSPAAVCFCARGAILRTAGAMTVSHTAPAERFLARAIDKRERYSIVSFNDSPRTTKELVLALYDRAIALASLECDPPKGPHTDDTTTERSEAP